MNLYVEHNASLVAGLGGHARPACDGVIIKFGDPSDVLAVTIRMNPLADGWLLDNDLPGARVVTWSGTLAADLFDAHPMTWMRAGHESFRQFCDQVAPQLAQQGRTLCFQPHARHVLSDPQSCLNFLRERATEPFELAFAPASFLEASMLDAVEEHLERAFESLPDHCSMVILHDIRVPEDEEAVLEPVALGEGVLPAARVRSLMEAHLPRDMPVIISPGHIDQQRAWLGV